MEMSDKWDGPMSVSIFAPGLDASFADDAIDGLRLCWPVLREFMTFHLGEIFKIFSLDCTQSSVTIGKIFFRQNRTIFPIDH